MDDYLFPFHTCERPYAISNHVAQPYSVLVNLISCFILIYALFTSRNRYIQFFFGTLFVFEMVHTYSHYRHLPNKIQLKIIHMLAYLVNITYLLVFVNITGRIPPIQILVIYFVLVLLDLKFFSDQKFIGYFTTQLLIISLTNIYFYPIVSHIIPKQYLIAFVTLILILILLFLNEMYNCEKMLNHMLFPYHVIVESIGVIIFVVYVLIMKKLDSYWISKPPQT